MVAGLPIVAIEADGQTLSPDVLRTLGALRVHARLSLPAQCELRFYDAPEALRLDSLFAPGTALRISAGEGQTPLFTGDVTALEYVYEAAHGAEIRVRGYDRLHLLRKRQSARVHMQLSVAELAQALAGDVGLSVEAADSGPFWPHVYQHNQTDLEFLVALTERCGLYVTLREGTLHLITLEGIGESLALALGRNLLEARFEVNGDPACRSVSASGWTPDKSEIFTAQATAARAGWSTAADADPGRFGAPGERLLLGEVAVDQEHALGLAQAELDRQVAREVTFRGVAEGDARLRPGAPVDVSGVSDRVAGQYVLTEVTHTIDAERGFISQLSSLPPPPRPIDHAAMAAPALVSHIDDPDGLGRVRCTLPTFGDAQTSWLAVLTIGAGSSKGVIALPGIGDRVLVLMMDGDPAQGVVLGGLYGTDAPPDLGLEGGERKRFTFVTPGGQRIQMDDAAALLRLENQDGSFVELAPGKVRLHAATDLEIEAPGKAIVIRGQSVDFDQG